MAAGFQLKKVAISGFRGYGEKSEVIDLACPVVLLIGKNRSGKSSTLNAIEWALYGSEVVGKKMGIEERKGWQVVNLLAKQASVELVLSTPSGDLKVVRKTGRSARRSGETFFYIDSRGNKVTDETKLWARLGLDAKDFMSSVYLHQELIRDILVTTPSVRRDALDRLLGVSDLRALQAALGTIKRSRYERHIGDLLEDLEDLIETRTQAYREQIQDAEDEGREIGLTKSEFSLAGLKKHASQAARQLRQIAQKAKLKLEPMALPKKVNEYSAFIDAVESNIETLRSENPAAASQRDLYRKRGRLEELSGEFQHSLERVQKVKDDIKKLEKRHGSLSRIRKKISELEGQEQEVKDKLEEIGGRISVVDETISYLEKLRSKRPQIPCPACEQPVNPARLLSRLKTVKNQAKQSTQQLLARRDSIREEIRRLQRTIDQLQELTKRKLPSARADVDSIVGEIADEIGKRIKDSDDPTVLIDNELARIERKLEKNKKVLKEYNSALSAVEQTLARVELIGRALQTANKIRQVESITKSRQWQSLRKQESKLMRVLDDIEKLSLAVGNVHTRITRGKLEAARSRIVGYYRMLVKRPDFDTIEIDQRDFDVYAVRNGKKEKVISIFNQGDMNCVALSIFLALAGDQAPDGPGFVMLDDPSQSLDSTQKRRLAEVIDRASASKQIILATMDEDLATYLTKKVAKRKKIYEFGDWDPQEGPTIVEG